ncbi:MAG: hypothetical protein JRN06_10190 [Nitrososphaerota archaeon]|nr:hypothetical protein [Nitrososphaerota archaeon]
MSYSGDRRNSLLRPLIGKTATFIVDGRETNVKFARTLASSIARSNLSCAIFDIDALYSSNADIVFGGLTYDAGSFTVRVPAPGSDIEAEFSLLFRTSQNVVVIDSLNSLYHLISMEDGSSRGRKLMFALESLSQYARSNGSAVILSMYRREGFARPGRGRSISNLSDVTTSVSANGNGIEMKTERGSAWPEGGFSSRIP